MKKLLIISLMFIYIHALCQQTSFVSGGIVYGITSDCTVEVLPNYVQMENVYSGAITIPQTVEHDGTVYTVTALGEQAFESATGVISLTLPPTIRSIGSHCFYNCSFTSLQLSDSLRVIADHAFLYSSVTTLNLPACFEEYGECAFWARNLTSITIEETNPHFRSIDGWLYSKDSLTLCVVPDGATGTIVVPSFVQHIGKMAFAFNSRATSVSLPEGLESIGAFAFNCCSAVDNIVIPSTVTCIGVCPFSYCPQLDNLTIADGNSHYVMDGLMLYSAGFDTLVSCHKSGATVTLNPNLKVLGGFENNTWLRSIDIPEGVNAISDNCFNGCSFTSITLPTHMRSIGTHAFSENNSLTSIVMPETLLSMGEGAFAWCMKLAAIQIPNSLRVIPKEAFNSCPRLASIVWGDVVEEIGYAAFWAMSATELVLPPTLRKLDDFAFAACASNLRTVTVMGQLDTMGEAVFRSANLDCLRFRAAIPPLTKGDGPLGDIGRLDSIVVPCGTIGAWLSDSYWGQFADKYHEECDGIDDVENQNLEFKIYSHNGVIVVEGVASEEMLVFDMMGRVIDFQKGRTNILPAGVYIVKIDGHPACKVAVVR